MKNMAICGIDCDKCEYRKPKSCRGCREMAGDMFWGTCDLAKCCIKKALDNCGQCSEFPCKILQEYAGAKNPERIQNLRDNN